MRSKILNTIGSIAALLAVLTVFFSIRPEGFLRRNEAAVTQAEVEAAGSAVTFTGKKAGADIPRVTGAEGELLAVGTFTFRRLDKAIGP